MSTFFIETFGCQMNQLDSELTASELIRVGLEKVLTPQAADVIIFNTCSIRQHAEDKVYSAIGRLKQWKLKKPFGVLGVMGCMAQKDQDKIISRAPHVDFIIGPGQLGLLVETVYRLLDEKNNGAAAKPVIHVSLQRLENKNAAVINSFKQFDPERKIESRKNRFQALTRIMSGCNKFCTYCVVPKVRGPEQCRHPAEIIDEIKQLVEQGVKEITLIGQTINSYEYVMTQHKLVTKDREYDNDNPNKIIKSLVLLEGGSSKAGCDFKVRFSDLIYLIADIKGLKRIKFVTNYPTPEVDYDLLEAVSSLSNVSKYFHIPVQSGSDSVLKRMKRKYTVKDYCRWIDAINILVPKSSVSTDLIVGFCGETESEFEETINLMNKCEFKNSFIFKYSERPDTMAAKLYKDDVPEHVKRHRNSVLLGIQEAISLNFNRRFIGQKIEILVECVSKNYKDGTVQLSGRTICDRIVVFDFDNDDLVGQFVDVEIYDVTSLTLFGELVLLDIPSQLST
ncbi:MAG: MiaB/RimO family radical SAM methylthiotransferase [Planctomycetaceae bacterium]|jgi:tRNA-2-methylthio-N6-dimethylallyladenosine synthase|nr:MiaB/RimO family radical SAM methylthiotransferase [Planctomycetaceae bacterium]